MDEWLARLGMKRAWLYAPTPLLIASESGEILDWNYACEDFFESGRSGLTGATFQELTDPDSLRADLALFQECLDGKRDCYRLQKTYQLRNGLKRTAMIFVRYLRKDGVFLSSVLPVDQFVRDLNDARAENAELWRHIESKDRELEILRNCAVHGSSTRTQETTP